MAGFKHKVEGHRITKLQNKRKSLVPIYTYILFKYREKHRQIQKVRSPFHREEKRREEKKATKRKNCVSFSNTTALHIVNIQHDLVLFLHKTKTPSSIFCVIIYIYLPQKGIFTSHRWTTKEVYIKHLPPFRFASVSCNGPRTFAADIGEGRGW